MFYTLTLNPAVDYVLFTDTLTPGQIHRCDRERVFFGGKGINVSTVLQELGIPSVALGFLAGFTGKAIADGVAEKGIATAFTFLQSGFTRINVKLRSGMETDFNGSGPTVTADDLRCLYTELDRLQDGDTLVIAGSVPHSLPNTLYGQILQHLSGKAIRCCVDASGELLRNTLPMRPFLIKPNLQELEELFSVSIRTEEETRFYAQKLHALGARNVLISLGKDGALLLDENGVFHRQAAFQGTVVNTVGAGDSMVAGFLAGLERTGSYAEALRLGAAAGSASAFSEGLADRNAIERLL